MPKVSVSIATYNRAHYLSQCIESVLAQDYRDFEIIVVDDGSTDNTRDVAERYGEKVTYIYQEHKGNIAAYYTGLAHSQGEYITYFGDDDVLLPGFLSKAVEVLDSNPRIAVFYSDCYPIDKDGKKIGHSTYLSFYGRKTGADMVLYDLFEFGCFVHGGVDRKNVFDTVGYFDFAHPHAADYDLWLRISGHGYLIYYEEKPLWLYRIHKGMRSYRESEMRADTVAVLEKNLERFSWIREKLGQKVDKRLGMEKAWLSIMLLWEGKFRQSLSFALKATQQLLYSVPLGAAQMAYTWLKGKRSINSLWQEV